MKREELKELGLEDDVIEKVMKLHGQSTEALKTKAGQAETEAATLKKQIEDANAQIESFKSMDVEGIKGAADDWKAKYEQARKDAADAVAKLKFDHALESALAGAKARDITAVRALLKADDLKLSEDGATVIGLDDQLKALREQKDFLFESDTPAPRIVAGTTGTQLNTDTFEAAMRKGAGLPMGE